MMLAEWSEAFHPLCYANLPSCYVQLNIILHRFQSRLYMTQVWCKSVLHDINVSCAILQLRHYFRCWSQTEALQVRTTPGSSGLDAVFCHSQPPLLVLFACRATHRETTVKPCWFSAEGRINFVTWLQLLLHTPVRNHETTAHTPKLTPYISICCHCCLSLSQAKWLPLTQGLSRHLLSALMSVLFHSNDFSFFFLRYNVWP